MATATATFRFAKAAWRLDCGFLVQPVHYSDDPAHDERWADEVSSRYGGRDSAGWLREYEMQPVARGRRVWPMLSRDVHVAFREWADIVSPAWTRYRVIDAGIGHPCCCGWVAVNARGDHYWYRQYYAADRTIAENAVAILDATTAEEAVAGNFGDPSIWARSQVTGKPHAEAWKKAGMPLVRANNGSGGYNGVAESLVASLAAWSLFHNEPHPKMAALEPGTLEVLAGRPRTHFHPACAEGQRCLYEECANLVFTEIRGDPFQHGPSQKPVDVNDEGPDVVRYARHTEGLVWRKPKRDVAADLVAAAFKEKAHGGISGR